MTRRTASEGKTEISLHEPVFDTYVEIVYSIAREKGVELLIVGGAPRELLLHRRPKDIDFVVMKGSALAVPLHLHTAHGFFYPVRFEKFGTYRTGIQGEKGIEMEFIPMRGKALLEDLALRDFTINTLTMRRTGTSTYEISDALGSALDDIDRGIIRTPIEPWKTIGDDPLRSMRAVRFACTIGMHIEQPLKEAVQRLAPLLNSVAAERIRDELFAVLLSDSPSKGIRLMQELGILEVIMPEVLPTMGFDQRSPYHKDELFTHSLAVMDRTRPSIETRLAALFHDTGKPRSMQSSPGKVTYYGHQDISAGIFRSFAGRLKLPHSVADTAEALIRRHMINYTPEWKDSAVRRFIKNNYALLDQLLDLYAADAGSLADPAGPLRMVGELAGRIRQQHAERISRIESPLDGNEIQEILGIPAGPRIGEIKRGIVDAILDGVIEPTKSSAEAFLRDRYAKG
ncbi:MAG: HD domain-containing protein [Deltaproteobacteria bacterium]|nr:HD domain-containing protein [Deltaproteobacteria bacterium]